MGTIPTLNDTETWTDEDLDALRVAVLTEQERRWTLATAEERVAAEVRRTYDAAEAALPPLAEGEHRPWTQPRGGHDAYPRGAVVAHDGRVWESRHPANVWEPGAPGVDDRLWVDVTEDAPDPEPMPDAPEFRAGEQVQPGDLRTYNGTVYRCIQPHTTADHWTPDVTPSLWARA